MLSDLLTFVRESAPKYLDFWECANESAATCESAAARSYPIAITKLNFAVAGSVFFVDSESIGYHQKICRSGHRELSALFSIWLGLGLFQVSVGQSTVNYRVLRML